MRPVAFLMALFVAGGVFAAVGEPAAGLISKADGYWADGRLDQAQKAFEAAATTEPNSSLVQLRLAGFQLANRQVTASIANYQKVIGLDPKNAKAWLGLGLAYLHIGKRELAKASIDKAADLDPQQKKQLAPLLSSLETPAEPISPSNQHGAPAACGRPDPGSSVAEKC